MHASFHSWRLLYLLLVACPLAAAGGCAAYQFGTRSLYRPDVRTVHVPVFQSDTFRRHLGELLTEAVVKELELKTPYRVASVLEADSVLNGRIISVTKRVLVEDPNDYARDIEVEFAVQFAWIDRRGRPIVEGVELPLPPVLLGVNNKSHFVPEAGQSGATAMHDMITRLARQIVAQMEIPW